MKRESTYSTVSVELRIDPVIWYIFHVPICIPPEKSLCGVLDVEFGAAHAVEEAAKGALVVKFEAIVAILARVSTRRLLEGCTEEDASVDVRTSNRGNSAVLDGYRLAEVTRMNRCN